MDIADVCHPQAAVAPAGRGSRDVSKEALSGGTHESVSSLSQSAPSLLNTEKIAAQTGLSTSGSSSSTEQVPPKPTKAENTLSIGQNDANAASSKGKAKVDKVDMGERPPRNRGKPRPPHKKERKQKGKGEAALLESVNDMKEQAKGDVDAAIQIAKEKSEEISDLKSQLDEFQNPKKLLPLNEGNVDQLSWSVRTQEVAVRLQGWHRLVILAPFLIISTFLVYSNRPAIGVPLALALVVMFIYSSFAPLVKHLDFSVDTSVVAVTIDDSKERADNMSLREAVRADRVTCVTSEARWLPVRTSCTGYIMALTRAFLGLPSRINNPTEFSFSGPISLERFVQCANAKVVDTTCSDMAIIKVRVRQAYNGHQTTGENRDKSMISRKDQNTITALEFFYVSEGQRHAETWRVAGNIAPF